MIKKTLLIGCKSGPWVPIAGIHTAMIVVQCGPHTKLLVHESGSPVPHKIQGPGQHRLLFGSSFIRMEVAKGDPVLVMCTLMGEESAAA